MKNQFFLNIKERLEFDEHKRIKNITQEKSMFLILWSFITRGLIMTVNI